MPRAAAAKNPSRSRSELRRALDEAGLTQSELSRRTRIEPKLVSEYVHELRAPRKTNAQKIRRVLPKLAPDYFDRVRAKLAAKRRADRSRKQGPGVRARSRQGASGETSAAAPIPAAAPTE